MNIHIVLKIFQIIKTFGRAIYKSKITITIEEVDKYQTDSLAEIMDFRKNMKPRNQEKKRIKRNCS